MTAAAQLALASLALLSACVPARLRFRPPPPAAILPPPDGEVYGAAPGEPRDPVVAALVRKAHADGWDEALSGAAGALALSEVNRAGEAPTRRPNDATLRWIALRAGWSGGVRHVATVSAETGTRPEAVLDAVKRLGDGPFGLARARGPSADTWVLLAGSPPSPAANGIPVTALRGERVRLPSNAAWRASAPDGRVLAPTGTLVLDAEGSWLLEARGQDGVTTTLPVFVRAPMPATPPPFQGALVVDTDEGSLSSVMEALAEWHGVETPRHEAYLDTVAKVRLATAASAPLQESLARLGWTEPFAGELRCVAPSVERCVEAAWWSVDSHAVLAGAFPTVGWAVERDASGVRIVVIGSP